jgi:hypothetical protein
MQYFLFLKSLKAAGRYLLIYKRESFKSQKSVNQLEKGLKNNASTLTLLKRICYILKLLVISGQERFNSIDTNIKGKV